MSAGKWIDDHATLLAIGGTILISFMNWRTAVAAKKSPLHDRLKETIANNKDFADRISGNLDNFFKELLPRLLPTQVAASDLPVSDKARQSTSAVSKGGATKRSTASRPGKSPK